MRKVQLMIKQEEVAPATTSDLVLMNNGRTLKEELSTHPLDKFSSAQTVTTSIEKIADGAYGGVYESGVMYGKTLVNLATSLHRSTPCTFTKKNLSSRCLSAECIPFVENKTYIAIVDLGDMSLDNLTSMNFVLQINPSGEAQYTVSSNGHTSGNKRIYMKFTARYTSTATVEFKGTATQWEKNTDGNPTLDVISYMILEYQEGIENWDVPYFTGICDVKMPILCNVGKNLFDSSQIIQNKAIAWASGNIVTLADGSQTHENFIPINYKSTYSVSGCNYIAICFYDANKQPVGFLKHNSKNEISKIGVAGATQVSDFNVSNYSNVRYMRITIRPNNGQLRDTSTLQIEESASSTAYEDYKTNVLRTPEIVTLRSLPNGVRDELNLMTGEYIKRIGEVVLDGSEEWLVFDTVTNARRFRHKPLANTKEVGTIACISDRLPTYLRVETGQVISSYTEHVGIEINSQELWIYTEETKNMATGDFKVWLSQNPVTIQYELKTPIITKVTLTQSEPIVKIGTELPNGVCDTYNLLTGEHIQRVGKVVLDGSEAWTKVAFPSTNTTHCYSSLKIENLKIPNVNEKNIVSDRFQTVPQENYNYNNEEMYTWRAGELLYVNILRSRLSTSDVQGLKAWLKENPTTVWYELKTPIVTKKNGLPNTHGVTLPNGEADKYNESTGVYTQNLGKVVLNGSQKLGMVSPSDADTYFVYHTETGINEGTTGNLVFNTLNDSTEIKTITGRPNSTGFNIIFVDQTINTVDKAKNYLASNPVEIYYLLATPKTIDIPIINVGQVLPNGVCDTYNPITKEYVKRVNKVMFDGSETWLSYDKWDTTNTSAFYLSYKNGLPPARRGGTDSAVYSIGYCDRFNYKSYNDFQNKVDVEGTIVYGGRDGEGHPGKIFSPQFSIKNSRLTTVDVDGFKTWLHNSNITYYYELATPETSFVDIDLSTLYSGGPVAYKNGHILLESGHEGQSLLPELTYSVPTSKTGVLSTTSKTILKHEERLSSFEKLLLRESVMMDYRLARSIFNEL